MRIVSFLLGGTTLLVIGIFVALNVLGADVVVTNAGTQTIRVRGSLPGGAESVLSAAGIRLPDELQPGVPAVVRVPRLSGIVQAGAGAIDVSLLGQTMHFSASCDSLDFNGSSLLGRQTPFDLGAGSRHEVRFACR